MQKIKKIFLSEAIHQSILLITVTGLEITKLLKPMLLLVYRQLTRSFLGWALMYVYGIVQFKLDNEKCITLESLDIFVGPLLNFNVII